MANIEIIPISANQDEVCRKYGYQASRRLLIKQIRCLIHPKEEPFIYAAPNESVNDEISESLGQLASVSNTIHKLRNGYNSTAGKTVINVEMYYLNESLYRFMPSDIFDTLEAGFLNGHETVEVSTESYNAMLDAIKKEAYASNKR